MIVTGCQFEMGPNAEIIVEPGITLIIDGCDFYSCDYLWRSIRVAPNGKLITSKKNGRIRIQDAWAAVFAHSRSHISLSGIDFDRNMIGLYIPPGFEYELNDPPVPFSNTIFLSRFSDLNFDCTSNLLSPLYPVCTIPDEDWSDENFFPVSPLSRSYAGVVVYDIGSISLGGPSIGSNIQYRNLNNGIIAMNTNLRVENSCFKHIPANNNYNIRGHGIYADGKNRLLKQIGYGKEGMPSFEDVRIAVFGLKTSVFCSDNNMKEVTFGIWTQNCKNRKIRLLENQIEAERFGMLLSHNDPTLEMDVSNNKITLTGTTPTFPITNGYAMSGIQINEMNQPHQGIAQIFHNEIIVGSGLWGILDEASTLLTIDDNFVELGTDRAIAGIGHFNCERSIIRDNRISGVGITSSGLFSSISNNGIYTMDSPLSYYLCNELVDLRNGLAINDLCLTSIVGRNNFNGPFDRGLLYNEFGFSGPQYNNVNVWPGETVGTGDFEAQHLGNDYSQYSKYFIQTNASADMNPDPVSPEDWFNFNDSYPEINQCNEFSWRQALLIPDSTDLLIAMDSIEVDEENPALLWNLKKSLYDYLSLWPDSVFIGTEYADFLSEYDTSAIAQWSHLEDSIRLALRLLSNDSLDLMHHLDTILICMDELFELQTVLDSTTSSVDSLTSVTGIDSLSELANACVENGLPGWVELDSMRTIALNGLLSGLALADISEVWTTSLKTVWMDYLQWIVADTIALSSSVASELDVLAGDCSRNFGRSVYLAGSLRKLNPNVIYTYDCPVEAKPTETLEPQGFSLVDFRLVPNPARDEVTVEWTDGIASGKLCVRDMSGRDVFCSAIQSSILQISLKNIPSGLYIVSWMSDLKDPISKVLIVQH